MTVADGAGAVTPVRLDSERIEISRRNGQVYAWCGTWGLHASAATADAALAELDRKLAELADFERLSGLEASTRLRRPTAASGFRGHLGRIGVPVLIGGLVALQLGWAISLGLANGFGRAFDARWRDGIVSSLERQFLALAESGSEPTVEQQRRLVAAARALKARYGPVWAEIIGDGVSAGR